MTDKEKLEAIRAEIHRLVDVRGYDREMANDLFAFMDSLPNEPVSEDLEKEIINYIGFQQEVDEDISTTMIRKAARHFANWQKEYMEKEYSDLNKGLVSAKGVAVYMAYETGKKDMIGKVRSILNKVSYRNNGLDVNGDYCEQPYVELDNEFRKLLKEG